MARIILQLLQRIFLMSSLMLLLVWLIFFFFNDTATTEIYTLSLHDALPISARPGVTSKCVACGAGGAACSWADRKSTRLNSSHTVISYAVFCLKKKNQSSHICATAKDISNVITDATSGVVDIFHGIDKAVAY